ncbi:MAG TPA: hypothetical protein VEJ87_00080, partial [Acidimicrobiales bacterium]|nr:hypothetical protein [Acidimicrobiales bacterium]
RPFDSGVAKVLTVIGFALPVSAYLVLLTHYQVNAVWEDQWADVPVIRESYVHFPNWSSLWTQHTENRMFFPNVIVVLLAHTVAYNIEWEQFLSALLLLTATALLIWSHKRRSPGTPLLYYCPVAFLTLTFAQWQDTLWGFQMAWYLVVLAMALTIVLLDRPDLRWLVFVSAALAAVVGSFSSLQGLLIWPVGLVLLYHRRRPYWAFAAWVGVAVGTVALYFHNFRRPNEFNLHFLVQFPIQLLQFFLLALGDVVGAQENAHQAPNGAVMAFGAVILVLAAFVVLRWGLRRDDCTGSPIGVALIIYGLLFDALISLGRLWEGLYAASQSRYTTNDVLVLTGIYLTALGASRSRVMAKGIDHGGRTTWRSPPALIRVRTLFDRITPGVVLPVTAVMIAIQIVCSVHFALPDARQAHQEYLKAAAVTRNIDHEPGIDVLEYLYFAEPVTWVRTQAHFLEVHHLSVFR